MKERIKNSLKSRQLDKSRRVLLSWYQKVVYYHQFHLLQPRFLLEFPGPRRANHFLQSVEPLALANCRYYQVFSSDIVGVIKPLDPQLLPSVYLHTQHVPYPTPSRTLTLHGIQSSYPSVFKRRTIIYTQERVLLIIYD